MVKNLHGELKLYIKETQKNGVPLNNPHPGVVCDGCGEPINGIRYKCTVCPTFDLCATCEVKVNHPLNHDMLCIKKPVHSPGYNVNESKRCASTVPPSGANCPLKLLEDVGRSVRNDVESGVVNEKLNDVIKNIASGFGLDPDAALMNIQTFFDQNHPHTESGDSIEKNEPIDNVEQKDVNLDDINHGSELLNNSGIDEPSLQCTNEILMFRSSSEILTSDKTCTQIYPNLPQMLDLSESSERKELHTQPTCEEELSKDVSTKVCDSKECSEQNSNANEGNKSESQCATGAIPRKPTTTFIPSDETNTIPFVTQLSKESDISNEQLRSLGQVIGSVMQDIGSHFSSVSSGTGGFDELSCQAENTSSDAFILVHNTNQESDTTEENAFEKKLNDSVQQMKAMGFEFDVEWLKQILKSKNLNINEVLDMDIFQTSL